MIAREAVIFLLQKLGFITHLKNFILESTQEIKFGDNCGLDQYIDFTNERQNLENNAAVLEFTREWHFISFVIESTDRSFVFRHSGSFNSTVGISVSLTAAACRVQTNSFFEPKFN